WLAEVSKFRIVLLEPFCSNSGRVGCHIALLKLPMSNGCTMDMNGCRVFPRLNCPLLTFIVYEFIWLPASISSIELETRLARPDNVFSVINCPMSMLTGLGEA
ncbi:hypothetical protein TNCV_2712951, partial [Trichonephila clavipes]